jgi:hypothetical protein
MCVDTATSTPASQRHNNQRRTCMSMFVHRAAISNTQSAIRCRLAKRRIVNHTIIRFQFDATDMIEIAITLTTIQRDRDVLIRILSHTTFAHMRICDTSHYLCSRPQRVDALLLEQVRDERGGGLRQLFKLAKEDTCGPRPRTTAPISHALETDGSARASVPPSPRARSRCALGRTSRRSARSGRPSQSLLPPGNPRGFPRWRPPPSRASSPRRQRRYATRWDARRPGASSRPGGR